MSSWTQSCPPQYSGQSLTTTFCFVAMHMVTFWKLSLCTQDPRKHGKLWYTCQAISWSVWLWDELKHAHSERHFSQCTENIKVLQQVITIECNLSAHACFQNVAFFPSTWKRSRGHFQIDIVKSWHSGARFHVVPFQVPQMLISCR